jgi:hypothetical protein
MFLFEKNKFDNSKSCFREKIRNIEETDKAKRKLLQTLCDKKGVEKKMSAIIAQSPAPINLLASTTVIPSTPSKTASVSFVQHKRCKLNLLFFFFSFNLEIEFFN